MSAAPRSSLPSRVDFHNHLLARVDDGARRVEQGVESLRAMAAQRIVAVVVSPHFDASLTRNPAALGERLAQFDRAYDELAHAIELQRGLPHLHRGTEVMLDEPDPDLSDPRIRLNGSRFVLCEFPSLRLPPNAEWGIGNLVARGWTPIVAHPERYRNLDANLEMLRRLREAGAFFQLNATSLIGKHGEDARKVAIRLLEFGWGEYCCSDHHARGTPATAQAVSVLNALGGLSQARRMTEQNPTRMLAGEDPHPVEPLEVGAEVGSWWGRLIGRKG